MREIPALLFKQLKGTISVPEKAQLDQWISASHRNRLLFERINNVDLFTQDIAELHPENWQRIDGRIRDAVFEGIQETESGQNVHRVHLLKTAWFRYAAAIIILFTGLTVYLLYPKKQDTKVAQVSPTPVSNDVLPGSDRAILTLDNGLQIKLDTSVNALLKERGITSQNSTIIYGEKGITHAINTLATPKGGQYKLQLPDGTMVWLNAASTITYPTAFTGAAREVNITGEVYFEVTPNKSKPFIVHTGQENVTVLGTAFNVNTYSDEPQSRISLLEGSVTINDKILKPGEAYINGTIIKTNIQQDLSWKNGLFNFNGTDLPAAMRQLERWYDIEVKYEGKMPELKLRGKMQRELTLLEVLEVLKEMHLKFTIYNKTLLVQ